MPVQALMACVAVLTYPFVEVHAGRPVPIHGPHLPVASTFPTLPPPALAKLSPYLPRYLALAAAYDALPSDAQPAFSQWLVMNGVIDPVAFDALMQLHAWYTRYGLPHR